VKFGVAICHEGWRYPETVRWAAVRGAKIVFHPHHTGSDHEGVRPTQWGAAYAVVFTSINANVDHTEHVEMYARLVQRAATYEGYLGIEPARNGDGTGVAKDPEHQVAKRKGRELWYSRYMIRICRVEREYGRRD